MTTNLHIRSVDILSALGALLSIVTSFSHLSLDSTLVEVSVQLGL